jgi:hypothetical protein
MATSGPKHVVAYIKNNIIKKKSCIDWENWLIIDNILLINVRVYMYIHIHIYM